MERLRAFPTARGDGTRDRARIDLVSVLWFFGAIAAGVASLAVIDRIPQSGRDIWVLLASLGFLAAYAATSWVLLHRGWIVPGGLMAALAVAMVPAIGYGFTQLIGLYPDDPFFEPFDHFSGTVFGIGVATFVAGLVAFALTRFAFVLALVVAAFLITAQLLASAGDATGDSRAWTAVATGSALVGLALLLDARGRRREAFWFHVGGLLAVAGALVYFLVDDSFNDGPGTGSWIWLLVAGAVVLLLAGLIHRSTLAVYGTIGLAAALAHYLDVDTWTRYVLLVVSLGVFALGLAVASRRESWQPGNPSQGEPAPPLHRS